MAASPSSGMSTEVPRAVWPPLMQRAQDGDRDAYALLLKSMIPTIRSMTRRQILDEVLVEDVIQDVLLTVHRVRHTYDPGRPILPWVAAIVSARAIDALRRHGRYLRREVVDEDSLVAEADGEALRQMEGFAAEHQVEQLLRQLPPRQRAAVEMVRLREMSLADAAAESSQSVSTLKALLHRAYTKLRQNGMRDHG